MSGIDIKLRWLRWAAPAVLYLGAIAVLIWFMAAERAGSGYAGTNAFAVEQGSRESSLPPAQAPPPGGLPPDDAFREVARSGNRVLKADPATGHFQVADRTTGSVWRSYPNPDGWTDEGLSDTWKLRMRSPLTFNYVETAANQSLERSTDLLSENGTIAEFAEIDGGFRVTYEIGRLGLVVPVEVRLRDSYVETHIAADGILGDGEAVALTSMRLYPFFGAETSAREDGFLFIPDGSGALIDFERDRSGAVPYYLERVYGADRAFSFKNTTSVRLPVRFPVFGMKTGEQAFLGVIHEGAEYANLMAAPSGSLNQYNWVTPELLFRFTYFQPTRTDRSQGVYAFSGEMVRANRTTRYYLIAGHHPDYADLAAVYRKYLIDEQGLTPPADVAASIPLHLSILGADTVSGFWRDADLPLTTASQAMDIVKELSSHGVEDMEITYLGWQNGGFSRYGKHFPVNGALGGNDGMARFIEFAHGKGASVLLDASSYSYNNTGGGGFRRSRDGLRDLSSTVIDAPTEAGVTATLVSPLFMKRALERDLDVAARLGADGYRLGGSLGAQLDSDFNDHYALTRAQALELQQDLLQGVRKSLGSVTLAEGNLYALRYADHLEGLAANYSYDMFVSRNVPFFHIALHGLVSYSLEHANLSEDYRTVFLKGIEYGAEPSFLVTYAPSHELLPSPSLSRMYSTHYRDWLVEIVSMVQRYNEALGDLRGSFITGHAMLADGVYETTYDNGVRIVVNYNDTVYRRPGLTVQPYDFARTGGE